MEVNGYVRVIKNPSGIIPNSYIGLFSGYVCPAMEFNQKDKTAVIIHPVHAVMCTVPYRDISHRFRCTEMQGVICPPGSDIMMRSEYVYKARKIRGGYNKTTKKMVILKSLKKGKFNDSKIVA